MRKTIITIPTELSDSIQACQIELDGLKELIAFLLASVEYNIPEERINKLQKDFINVNKTYKPGSMAAKANMVRDYNERNSRK